MNELKRGVLLEKGVLLGIKSEEIETRIGSIELRYTHRLDRETLKELMSHETWMRLQSEPSAIKDYLSVGVAYKMGQEPNIFFARCGTHGQLATLAKQVLGEGWVVYGGQITPLRGKIAVIAMHTPSKGASEGIKNFQSAGRFEKIACIEALAEAIEPSLYKMPGWMPISYGHQESAFLYQDGVVRSRERKRGE